jgi:hypothetical protein
LNPRKKLWCETGAISFGPRSTHYRIEPLSMVDFVTR